MSNENLPVGRITVFSNTNDDKLSKTLRSMEHKRLTAIGKLEAELAEAKKRNEDLLAWIRAALPCVRLCAESYDWPSAKRLLEDAPTKNRE